MPKLINFLLVTFGCYAIICGEFLLGVVVFVCAAFLASIF